MTQRKPLTVNTLLLGLSISLASGFIAAQDEARPDLSGTWTNASLTGLSRPNGVEPLVVSEEVAAKIAAGTPIAGLAPGYFD